MAYNANGKTYTDHPLMDEILYHCRKILEGIVVKNDVLANRSETENSVLNAEMFYIQYEDGYIPFSVFPFTREYLSAFGYPDEDITKYLLNKENIPVGDRELLTNFCNELFRETFEEENDYYRTLMGLPKFGSGEEYYLYLVKSDVPAKYLSYVDLTVPVHLQPLKVINVLYSIGVIQRLRSEHPGSNYSYLEHLGNRAIDLYKARKASKWDILYMPNVYYLVEDQFTEIFYINRDIYMNQTYQEVYADTSDYYDQMMILLLLSETFANIITDTPEWYIRRDIFDIRSVKYFLESYGVAFFKEIPLKYQVRIVKNLNKLIKFKSSTKNIRDIVEIFTQDTVDILKYWLFKNRNMDDNGHYIRTGDINLDYNINFIHSAIDKSYDDYIKDNINKHSYNDITYQDKYWDGEDEHTYIHNEIINRKFTIEGTKFMSIEYKWSLSEVMFQIEYFLGLILDSRVDMNDIRIAVPTVDEIADFSLSNIFLYLIILSSAYYRKDKNDHMFDLKLPDTSVGNEPTMDHIKYEEQNLVDWRVKNIPEIFVPKNNRVHAFNTKFNREQMENFIKTKRHSHYLFGASYNNVDYDNPGQDKPLNDDDYAGRAMAALEELGINDFIIPQAKYDNIDEVINLYKHNRKTYETLIDKIRECDNEDDLSTLAYIYEQLYTREFDSDLYKLSNGQQANTLIDILRDRDYVLYDSFYKLMNESNMDARQDNIRAILNDIVETLEFYISGDGLEYLFSFTPTESFFNIVYYIYLMIGFFKSYKVYFLDPYTTMVVDNKMDPLDAKVRINDRLQQVRGTYDTSDKAFVTDVANMKGEMYIKENDSENVKAEMVDIFGYHEEDPNEDIDYDGLNASRGEDITIKDMDGGDADETKARPYKDLDAGHSYLGMHDIDDLNGGDADEDLYEDYYDVDGGNAYHTEDERTDWYGTQGFNYDLDGGGSSNIHFMSRTIETKVFDYCISMDVLVSKKKHTISNDVIKENPIYILDDGLYVPDTWATNDTEFNALVADFAEFIKELKYSDTDIMSEIAAIESIDDIIIRIKDCIDDILGNMYSSYNDVINGALMNRITNFVDSLVTYTQNRYADANPYAMVDL